MNKLENKSYTLEEILDSDDELPTDYIEIPFVPAYQNNNRFEFIEEEKNKHAKLLNKHKLQSSEEVDHIKPIHVKSSFIILGYLNKKDKFCLQSLEFTTSKDTQLWFLNFLLVKDLQKKYKSLTACLVSS